MKSFREYLNESRLGEKKFDDGGIQYESDGAVLFNTIKKNLAEAEKIYKWTENSPLSALKEHKAYYKKFEPKNAKLLGIRLQLEDGFNNANIIFLIEFESSEEKYKGKIQSEEVIYSLSKKKFGY
jgi:hypothetical protein